MRHTIKTLSVALAAVFVFGAIAAAGASASQPKAELESGAFPITFTGSGGTGVLEVLPEPKRKVTCTSNTSSGNIASSTTITGAKVIFKGCTAEGPFGNVSCNTSGANSGEIKSTTLKGKLVYLIAGSARVGMDLEPETGTEFAKFVCGGVQELIVTGSVIGELTKVNEPFGTSFTLTFTQTEGHQAFESYLNPTGCTAVKDVLMTEGKALFIGGENFAAKQSAVQGTEALTTSKKMKIVSSKCE
jgi:hypothetical protein